MTEKMEIQVWDGGLTQHEIRAIGQIEQAFCAKELSISDSKPAHGASMAEQLSQATGRSASRMWPWKGYAGFRFADSRGYEGEFDLVIVTHCSVLIVELKDWNGELTENEGNWYLNGREMGRSPVAITQNKQYLLMSKLKKYSGKFQSLKGGKYSSPKVEFCVVLTGKAKSTNLPEVDRLHTMSLNEFISLADEEKYVNKYRPHKNSIGLNQDIPLFDDIFLGKKTKPKHLIVNGYKAVDKIFPLNDQDSVYTEFRAESITSSSDEALLRQWNFELIPDPTAKTPDGRFRIVSREQDILTYIKTRDYELYQHCLRSLKIISPQEVTQQFHELYELPTRHHRFNEFIERHLEITSTDDRISLVKILLHKFSQLHAIKIAHRDIGDHSLWLSPAKQLALSNFISAYYQPAGTVGEPRKTLSVGAITIPCTKDKNSTPFTEDVYCLGIMCWLILEGKRLSDKNLSDFRTKMVANTAWYMEPIRVASSDNPSDRYATAEAFLEDLKNSTPIDAPIKLFDDSVLDSYRKSIRLNSVYPDDSFLSESDTKEVYRSGDSVVKIWNAVSPTRQAESVGVNVVRFLKRLEILISAKPDYIANIRDFGLATRTSQLYLVQDYIDGQTWADLVENTEYAPIEEQLTLINSLIDAVDNLHLLKGHHGDLHPENILIVQEGAQHKLYLIDFPDFQHSEGDVKNNRYSPENSDTSSAIEVDNYAVIRLCADLLKIDWDQGTTENGYLTPVIEAISQEKVSEDGFISLERFRSAVNGFLTTAKKGEIVQITLNNSRIKESISILPDNGKLYVSVELNDRKPESLFIRLAGIGGQVHAIYDPSSKTISRCFVRNDRTEVTGRERNNADFVMSRRLEISKGISNNLEALAEILISEEGFLEFAEKIIEIQKASSKVKTPSEDLKIESNEQSAITQELYSEQPRPVLSLRKSIANAADIWQAIIDSEVEALPQIEIADEPRTTRDGTELIIPYLSDSDVLEPYARDDDVELVRLDGEKVTTVGKINISKSTPSAIRLSLRIGRVGQLTTGENLSIRTTQDRSSFLRRKTAVTRILERRGVVRDLIDFFERDCTLPPELPSEPPTVEAFKAYDRVDDQGNVISLNEEQRRAFTRLITTGPLCLLQGPPGTGKTEFIAAFTHYLVANEGVQNILLVSQSHEAVNTAAERIRRHCHRLNTQLDVVRFSNREGAVSNDLLDVYSQNIVAEKLALFDAEYDQRLIALQHSLGVPKDYLLGSIDAEQEIGKRIRQCKRLDTDIASNDFSSDEINRLQVAKDELRNELNEISATKFKIENPEELELTSMLKKAIRCVSHEYGIAPHEEARVQSLIQLSQDFREKLATVRVNYDEFLGRSRTLVCGTCVGVGQQHMAIIDNQYDWVIIDEAARSSASELAVAMQVGKRILLVGDHQQLPPLYHDQHRVAVGRKLGLSDQEADFAKIFASDFEKCFESDYGTKAGATLLTQYRMLQPIGDLVSDVFYNNELKTGQRDMPECFLTPPEAISNEVTWIDTTSLGRDGEHKEDSGTSIYNIGEIRVILNLLKKLEDEVDFCESLNGLLKDGEAGIGVICMYSEQKRQLRRLFHEQEWRDDFKQMVKIDTVDSYQGKENRIVILSLTRHRPNCGPGFLKQPNRINVSMSRAMDRLVVVGATQMWADRTDAPALANVLNYIKERLGKHYAFKDATLFSARRDS